MRPDPLHCDDTSIGFTLMAGAAEGNFQFGTSPRSVLAASWTETVARFPGDTTKALECVSVSIDRLTLSPLIHRLRAEKLALRGHCELPAPNARNCLQPILRSC